MSEDNASDKKLDRACSEPTGSPHSSFPAESHDI
jgi:hypothetical protein